MRPIDQPIDKRQAWCYMHRFHAQNGAAGLAFRSTSQPPGHRYDWIRANDDREQSDCSLLPCQHDLFSHEMAMDGAME